MSEQPGQGGGSGSQRDTGHPGVDTPPQVGPAGQSPMGGPPAVDRAGWRALWLGGGALLVTLFFFPIGLVLGVAALVVGIKARRRAKQRHGVAPGAIAGIVLGGIGVAISTFSLTLTVFLWPELSGYNECKGKANTTADEQSCQDEYFPKIENKLKLPDGSMSKYGDLF